MKKRSLVSAIAMLVVSAIVLTSATFAWFTTGKEAKVNQINATVSNAEGSILISADGQTWTTTLNATDFGYSETDPVALSPVSIDAEGNAVAGAIEEGIFTASDAAGKYVKFQVQIKSDVDCQVAVAPQVSAEKAYVFAGATMDGAFVAMNGGQSYYPYTGAAGDTATDTNNNAILDAGETDALGAQVTGAATLNKTISLTAGTAKTLTFYLWAEGQHEACKGNTSDAPAISVNFTKLDAGE